MRKDAPLAVDLPAPERDRPAWVKVGVIAAVGFVIGVAWPRIAGVRLGPSAPGESTSSAQAAARAPESPPASVSAKTAAPSASAAPAAPPVSVAAVKVPPVPPQITVGRGNVLSCKTVEGETKKGKECGPLGGLDAVVQPRLKKLASCTGIEGTTGKLSLIATADFASNRFSYEIGKSSTVRNEAVTACLKNTMHGVNASGIAHEHHRYTVSYVATFAPGRAPSTLPVPTPAPPVQQADAPAEAKVEEPKSETAAGEAAVAWDVALVRDVPKTGQVVARLTRGTKVKIGTMKDGWYSVKYGDEFKNDGWVYRGAIGR